MVIVSKEYLREVERVTEILPRYFIGFQGCARVYAGTQLADVAQFLQNTRSISLMNHGDVLVIERFDMSVFDLTASPEVGADEEPCDHGVIYVRELGMTSEVVRRKYPRLSGTCPKGCGYVGIAYASFEHFIAGDW